MHTEHHIRNVQRIVNDWKRQGLSVGFVPTMGNLHAGHLALVKAAGQRADRVVVSIFVNPIQFGPNEDFDSYPRTLEQDAVALAEAGIHLLFAPSVNEMYPDGREAQTRVSVPGIGDLLEGESRPGFFTGVATVVNKLFNIVPADLALFGEKDFQQLQVIRRMVADLNLSMEVVGVPTVREPDGLALSSRNGYLSPDERARAPGLYEVLCVVRDRLRAGEDDYAAIEAQATAQLAAKGFVPDYLAIRRDGDLQPAGAGDTRLVVLAAARLGTTRLIDNISLEIQ
jgi:pantoate--beta-alanine ligase